MGTQPRAASRLGNTHEALRRCWHPVARASEVTEAPTKVRLLDVAYVLYRTGDGVRAFRDRCPHRLAPLSLATRAGDGLRCAYHGWCFAPSGECTEIPALGPTAAIPPRARLDAPAGVAERHGMVFLAPEAPLTPLPVIDEADDPRFERGEVPTVTARAGAGLMADNFLDFAHFPFVHAATFGTDESAELQPYRVQRDGWSFSLVYEHAFANREDPGVAAGLRPLVQTRRMTYRYTAPFFLSLRLEFLEAEGVNTIAFSIQPETEDRCRLYTTLWRDDLGGDALRMAEALEFEAKVLSEDLALQSSYDELSLPLDLTEEVHTRADRTTLELRRVLADLVAASSGHGDEGSEADGERDRGAVKGSALQPAAPR